MDIPSNHNMHTADEDENPVQAPTPTEIIGGDDFLRLQEANNISVDAFKEFMATYLGGLTCIATRPALGSSEDILQVFHSMPTPGRRIELSIESAVVPIAPDILVSMMMDVSSWALSMSHIVYHSSSDIPPSSLKQLSSTDASIKKILKVTAEFQLPTPLVERRNFLFLRCLKEINRDKWFIFDVSNDYLLRKCDISSGQKCLRTSGLLVSRMDQNSQVIWVENLEMPVSNLQDNIYGGMISSNMGFSAKRWVSTLKWWLKRNDSTFSSTMPVNGKAHAHLLNLTELMKMTYLDIVNATPDDKTWDILSNGKVRVLRSTAEVDNPLYIGVTSFRFEAKPSEVFDYLVEKNVSLKMPISLKCLKNPEEIIRSVSDDKSNCITLLRREVCENGTDKSFEYMLQEASNDGFCSFVISAPMSQQNVDAALFYGTGRDTLLQPSGFAIVPNGSDSGASIVTIAMETPLLTSVAHDIVEAMEFLLNYIVTGFHDFWNEDLMDSEVDSNDE